MPYPIYTGDEARKKVNYLLTELKPGKSQYQLELPKDRCCGFFRDGKRWIAFENRGNKCWAEEFRTEKRCLKYLGINKP